MRQKPEHDGRRDAEAGAQGQRDPAGPADRRPVAPAGRQADPDRGRLGDAERHHEGHGGALEGDGMGRQLLGAHAHDVDRGGEESRLGENREANRHADPQHLAKARPVGAPEAGQQGVAAEPPVPLREAEQGQQHDPLDQTVADAGTDHPEGGKAEIAEHQGIIPERMQHGPGDDHDQGGPRPGMGHDEGTQHDHQKARDQAPHGGPEIGLGQDDAVLRLSQKAQQGRRVPHQQAEQESNQGDRPEALAHAVAHGAVVARAQGLRRHGRDRDADAQAEQVEWKVEVDAERAAGELLGAEPAQHHRVDGADRDLAQLGHDQRQGQQDGRPDLGRPQRGGGWNGGCGGVAGARCGHETVLWILPPLGKRV